MRHFSRLTAQGKLSLLLGFVASLLAFSVLATPAFAASTVRNSQPAHNTWKVVPSPGQGLLSGAAVISANDIWSVGDQGLGTLTEHWNGSAWSIVSSPNQGSNDILNSVSAVSTSDVWAVGWQYFPNTGAFAPLIEHWNGSAWSLVSSPNPNSNSYFNSVVVVSASDVWAVGNTVTQQGQQTLIEQWNGSSWNVVASPSSGNLNGVAVVSANDIWAVGVTNGQTLTEHWNGSRWKVVSSPSFSYSVLTSLSVVSTSDIWAVGYGTGIKKDKTLTEHWNGTTWKIVVSPNVPSGPNGEVLNAVAAVSTNNVWAMGSFSTGDNFFSPVIQHWNGTKWTVVISTGIQDHYNTLLGVVSVPGGKHLWAVGSDAIGDASDYTFIEYYG